MADVDWIPVNSFHVSADSDYLFIWNQSNANIDSCRQMLNKLCNNVFMFWLFAPSEVPQPTSQSQAGTLYTCPLMVKSKSDPEAPW